MCPYGTYQRATAGYRVRALTALQVCRLIRRKLKPPHRKGGSAKLRLERKAVYRSAIRHWRDDLDLMNSFRL